MPVEIGGFPEAKDAAPRGCDTAYVEHLGVRPARGRTRRATFRWSVTAVKAGPFEIDWRVAAGLDGKAKAVGAGRRRGAGGSFAGSVSGGAPETRVGRTARRSSAGAR